MHDTAPSVKAFLSSLSIIAHAEFFLLGCYNWVMSTHSLQTLVFVIHGQVVYFSSIRVYWERSSLCF